jgi:branched-chain amino acid transport system substrate-binding protein
MEEAVPLYRFTPKTPARLFLLVLLTVVAANCTEPTPTPLAPPETVPAPTVIATVEVTRIVEVDRVVTATPAPVAPACVRGDLASASNIVIGALAPLSRPGSLLIGFTMQTAFSLAVEDLNAAGGIDGKPVRLVTYDTANSPEQASLYAERLVTLDCAAVIVGGYHSQVAIAIKEVARRHGVPVIFSSAMTDELTADAAPEVFRIAPSFAIMAALPGQWLSDVGDYNQDGDKYVVLIVENSNDSLSYAERVRGGLTQAGFASQVLPVDLPTTDFSSVIARMVALDRVPDAAFLMAPGEAALQLQQQMLAAGIGPQQHTLLISNSSALNETLFWQRVPNGLYTVVARIGPWPSTVSAMGAQFAEKFRPYFDRWPDLHAFAAYDAVRLAGDAIQRAGSLDPSAIIRALEESDVLLASGRSHFPFGAATPPNGEDQPAHWWHQWLDAPLLYLQYSELNQPSSAAAVIWPPLYQTVDRSVLSQPGTHP